MKARVSVRDRFSRKQLEEIETICGDIMEEQTAVLAHTVVCIEMADVGQAVEETGKEVESAAESASGGRSYSGETLDAFRDGFSGLLDYLNHLAAETKDRPVDMMLAVSRLQSCAVSLGAGEFIGMAANTLAKSAEVTFTTGGRAYIISVIDAGDVPDDGNKEGNKA